VITATQRRLGHQEEAHHDFERLADRLDALERIEERLHRIELRLGHDPGAG